MKSAARSDAGKEIGQKMCNLDLKVEDSQWSIQMHWEERIRYLAREENAEGTKGR